jgi:hypothetical protein
MPSCSPEWGAATSTSRSWANQLPVPEDGERGGKVEGLEGAVLLPSVGGLPPAPAAPGLTSYRYLKTVSGVGRWRD